MSKLLKDMTKDERKAAIERVLDRLQAELTAAAPKISEILNEAEQS